MEKQLLNSVIGNCQSICQCLEKLICSLLGKIAIFCSTLSSSDWFFLVWMLPCETISGKQSMETVVSRALSVFESM